MFLGRPFCVFGFVFFECFSSVFINHPKIQRKEASRITAVGSVLSISTNMLQKVICTSLLVLVRNSLATVRVQDALMTVHTKVASKLNVDDVTGVAVRNLVRIMQPGV